MTHQPTISIVGVSLSGRESVWQLAVHGFNVYLYVMRPAANTGAHSSSNLAELVYSNSFVSTQVDRASGSGLIIML